MIRYIIKRLIGMIPLLIGITFISFFVIHLAPGSPVLMQTEMNPHVTKEVRERLIKYYNLDKPIHVRYLLWLKRVIKLDFGRSFAPDGRKVIDKIKERIPITLTINLLSMIIIILVSIPIGVYSAVKRGGFFDRVSTIFVFIGFAAPSFWIALLAMMLFGVKLGILPISGIKSLNYNYLPLTGKILDLAKHLLLPVLISAFGGLAGLTRFVRTSMIDVLNQDYIMVARAKGLPERTIYFKHALRCALLPVITILGLSVPGLIGGSVIFETIFGIPGMGQLFYNAVMARDYPLVMGILVIGALLTLLGNFLADISYALADPRIRRP